MLSPRNHSPRRRCLPGLSGLLLVISGLAPLHVEANDPELVEVLAPSALRSGQLEAAVSAWIDLLVEKPTGPRAAILRTLISESLERVARPLEHLEKLESLAAREELRGHAGDDVRQWVHDLYRLSGRHDDVLEHRVLPGLVTRGLIIGPLGLGLPGQYDRRFPVEESLDLERPEQGLRRDLSWRAARALEPLRFLEPRRFTRGGSGVHFFLAQVRVESAGPAWITLRHTGAATVQVNGTEVARESLDEDLEKVRGYPVNLREGWNHVLLKNLGESFQLQITDEEGRELPGGLELESDLVLHAVPKSGTARSLPETPRSSLASYRAHVVRELGDAEEHLHPIDRLLHRLGFALRASREGSSSVAIDQVEKTLELLEGETESIPVPVIAAIHYHAGRIIESCHHLPSEYRQRRAKLAFETCRKLDPGFQPAALELAAYLRDDDQPARASELLRELETSSKSEDPRRLELQLEIFRDQGWTPQALEAAARLEAMAPHRRLPHQVRAQRARQDENPRAALEHLRGALKADPSRASLLGEVARMEARLGDLESARKNLATWQRRRPHKLAPVLTHIGIEEQAGNVEQALELARAARERFPLETNLLEKLASLEESAGHPGRALEVLEALLELEPGRLQLADYLRTRRGQSEDRFWEEHDERLEAWLDRIPPAEQYPRADSLAVLDIAVLRLYPDGSSREYTHQAFRLLSEASRESLANMRTRGEILALRTLTPDGRSLEPVNALGQGAYVMPGLEVGATIEVAYATRNRGTRSWRVQNGPFYFQDFTFKQPFLLSRYVVILPRGLDIEVVERNLRERDPELFARVERREEQREDGTRVLVYETRSAPRLEPEIRMPDRDELIPSVRLVERRNWLEVAEYLESSLLGITRPTPRLESFLDSVRADLPAGSTPADLVRALHARINDLVKSQQGPRAADGILLERSGNRTVLFKALIDLAGIPAHWVFARPREELAPSSELARPGPELFNDLLVLVEPPESEPAWVDLSARLAPFGKLPYSLQLGTALVLKPGGPTFRTIPGASPEESAEELRARLELGALEDDPRGARVELSLISHPLASYANKNRLKDIDEHRRGLILQQVSNSIFPGARVKTGTFTDIEKPGVPFRVDLELEAPRLLDRAGDDLVLRPVLQPLSMVRSFIRSPRRRHPYHFRAQVVRRDQLEVHLGEGFAEVRLPADAVLTSPLGSYSLSFERRGDRLVIERETHLRPSRLPVEDFDDLLEFCREVDRLESRRIVLQPRA